MIDDERPSESAFVLSRPVAFLARNRSIRNSTIYTAGNFIPPALSVFALPIFTRYLTPEEFGIFGYITGLLVFLSTISTLAVNEYVLRHYFFCEDDDERRLLFGNAFTFLAVVNLGLLALELALLPILFRASGIEVPFYPFMPLALTANAIEALAAIPLAYFRVNERPVPFVALFGVQTVLSLGLGLYLVAIRDAGLVGRYQGQLAANVIMLAVYVLIIVRIGRVSWDVRMFRAAMAFSLPLVLSNIFFAGTSVADRFILERYVPLSQLGLFSVGFSIAMAISALSNGIGKAVEPIVFRAASENRVDEVARRLKGSMLVIMLMVGFLVVLMSREIVQILTGPAFHESYKIVILVAAAVVVDGLAVVSSQYMRAIAATKNTLKVTALGAAVGIGLDFALIPHIGIYGAGAATLMSSVTMLFAYNWLNVRRGTMRWNTFRDLSLATAVLAAAASAVAIELPLAVSVLAKGAVVIAAAAAAWAMATRLGMSSRKGLFGALRG